jgi:3-dehydroquinate synthase
VKIIEQDFTVKYHFPVIFTRDAFDPGNNSLSDVLNRSGQKMNRMLVVVDSSVVGAIPGLLEKIEKYGQCHRDTIELADAPYIAKGGEICKKDSAEVERIHALIYKYHLCRHSFILAIGGGAVLDAAGYAAATAHRGIRLIRMPATTLAQNDSGVGVKTGINGFGRKNYIGTFTPPYAVISDFDFLDTLPERDKGAGIAEAVKVAIIKDRTFFDYLYRERRHLAVFEPKVMEEMIIRSAELHIEHIGTGGDPFEYGSSRPLDFGHWSAHKIEELTGGDVRHGEAVAIGVALDSLYSYHIGNITEIELNKILITLEDIGFDLYHWSLGWMNIGEALREFQEHLGGELNITLLDGIGHKIEAHFIDVDLLKTCIDELRQRHKGREEKEKKNDHVRPPEIRKGDPGFVLHGKQGKAS